MCVFVWILVERLARFVSNSIKRNADVECSMFQFISHWSHSHLGTTKAFHFYEKFHIASHLPVKAINFASMRSTFFMWFLQFALLFSLRSARSGSKTQAALLKNGYLYVRLNVLFFFFVVWFFVFFLLICVYSNLNKFYGFCCVHIKCSYFVQPTQQQK